MMCRMRIVVLAGGIGGARFLRGLAAATDADVTVIGNTGDDIRLFGLRICPDLDTVMYTLGGGIDPEHGWGRSGETFAGQGGAGDYGVEPAGSGSATATSPPTWSDADARAGYPLSEVTAALCDRWQPGVRLLPMTDDRVETHVAVDERTRPGAAGRALPGVLGPTACAEAHDGRRAVGAEDAKPGARGAGGVARQTSCCCRRPTPWSASGRSWPSRASPRRCGRGRPGRRGLAASSGAPGARDGRPAADRDRRRVDGRGGRPALRRLRACSTAGWSTLSTPRRCRASRRPASRAEPSHCSCATWTRRAAIARATMDLAEEVRRMTVRPRLDIRAPALPEIGPGTTWPR